MDGGDRFEGHRGHLRAVAYRMLGSLDEADDVVQEAWLRYRRSDPAEIENLRGWLVTVTSRICLDQLRARSTRREDSLEDEPGRLPDPVITAAGTDPEHEAVLADAVGLALQVVISELAPPERVAFVLHDLFAVPFADIGDLLGRSPSATKQLAHRARRRVSGAVPNFADQTPSRPPGRSAREVVDAFFAAARSGDLDRLVSVLDPDVVVRTDGGLANAALTNVTRGARAVAMRARSFASPRAVLHPVLVNGDPGVIVTMAGVPVSVLGFTVRDGQVVVLHALADPERLGRLDLEQFL
ncbi:sigma-70 family RNA polymerase sigma factor [Kineosporia babensis]|uniref:Sigma-70 family RNA polymerase sigma factor n=1 Tax=Kineosporia babensis TaxID=499548 RepID=A0A9X1NMP4_9ACTN|nr:sigma-70 family RNA polymerase sigma factor [Kineosporia babensis]MCD5315918.1 sigma-70 family RNA polymerase sigma factor [Kineosporia babensis]